MANSTSCLEIIAAEFGQPTMTNGQLFTRLEHFMTIDRVLPRVLSIPEGGTEGRRPHRARLAFAKASL